jgi:hypothetical protein
VVKFSGTYGILYMNVPVMEPLISCYGNLAVFSMLLKISELMHCIMTAITSALFIGFKRVSNGWKVLEVGYHVDIGSFMRLY